MTGTVSKSDIVRRATLGDQLRRHARTQPKKPAVIYYRPNGDREEISYSELNARANALAMHFRSFGVGRGDRVAMMSRNSPDYIVAWYATLKLGAAFTGVNFTFTEKEITYQINHAAPKVMIVEDAFRDKFDKAQSELNSVTTKIVSDTIGTDADSSWLRFSDLIASGDRNEIEAEVDEDDIAMLVYTSGTEAFPKGVMIPHRNYIMSTTPAWSYAMDIRMEDRWLFLMPFHTIAGLGSMTTLTQIGATVILAHTVDPALAVRVIASDRITVMAQTPTFYLAMIAVNGFAQMDVGSLRRCLTYGGVVPKSMIDAWASAAPEITWGTYWGQSELSQLGSTGWFKTLEDIPGQDPSWIGKPVPQLEIRIVDDEGNDATEGELICRSPSAMLGYLNDPEKTAETIKNGWLHTGDLVRIDDDGNLFFVDRKKDMIKTGGYNVSSVEVERALYQFPAALEVAVVGVPDPYWSEAVTACIVLKPGHSATAEEFIAHCKGQLASFKVPKAVHIVEALPKDTQGKILKRELRKQFTSQ